MHRLRRNAVDRKEDSEFKIYPCPYIGCTPIHILYMQKQPKISLVKEFCRRDPKAFALCDETGKSVLHIVAQYSESLGCLRFYRWILR
jgi:hypothetical protein